MRELMVKQISKKIRDDLDILTMIGNSCVDFNEYQKMHNLLANKMTLDLFFANNVVVYDHTKHIDKYSIIHKN